jgi:hypothetical protein
MLRTYLVCREREREASKRHVGEAQGVLITATLLLQRLNCYCVKVVSLRMLTDLRLTTAQQRTSGQNLQPDLYHESVSAPFLCPRNLDETFL